jgi:BolA family transcriptional regulator, general stress-responsive regulator
LRSFWVKMCRMIKVKIEHILTETFAPDFLEVVDESHKHVGHAGASQGGHYQVTIVSRSFEGKKLLESHRMIYQALEPVKSSIHALAIKVSAA